MAAPLRDMNETGAAPSAAGPDAAPDTPLPRYRSRYSRFVLLMKLALPVIAGVVIVLVIVWPELTSSPERFRIGISDLSVETAGGQRVVNARFNGIDSSNRPYSVTADAVVQAENGKGRFELNQPKADITLESGAWVAITSPSGTYWRNRELLQLAGGVNLFHDQGYEFKTPEASIDFASGTAAGDRPVAGQGPFGRITAEGFHIVENGARVLFKGKASLILYPNRKQAEGAK